MSFQRLDLCAEVNAYVAAKVDADGSLWMGGRHYLIKRGTHVEGEAALEAGARVCISAKVEGGDELSDPMKCEDGDKEEETPPPAEETPPPTDEPANPQDCDMMPPAEETPPPGDDTPPPGDDTPPPGDDTPPPCTSNCGGSVDQTTELMICGKLDALVQATASAMGYVSICGHKIDLNAGVKLVVDLLVQLGVDVCVSLNLDVQGEVKDGSIALDLLGSARVHVCGEVHAYVAATASSAGELWIGGRHFSIAAGSVLDADAMLDVNAKVCVDASLDLSGKIVGGYCKAD